MTTGAWGPVVSVEGASGGRATVALQGGHVVSWTTADGSERLYMSSLASASAADGSPQALRGGIPVCFPQFAGLGALPKHGFARTSPWSHEGDGRFVLEVGEGDWPGWPHRCVLRLDVVPGADRLELRLTIDNVGADAFAFTAALHTYLLVDDVTAVRVHGLDQCGAIDPGLRLSVQRGDLGFGVEVDRQLLSVAGPIEVGSGSVPSVRLAQSGFADAVVWNIGPDKAGGLADLGAGEWRRYVCVEAAQLRPTVVAPGGQWSGSQLLVVPGTP
jgi:glucose-6-phosphate 1-epimerase